MCRSILVVRCYLFIAVIVCVPRFRPLTKTPNFFVRFGKGNRIKNGTKELDALQAEFKLPSMCTSNARHVVETLKGDTGLDASASAGKFLLFSEF